MADDFAAFLPLTGRLAPRVQKAMTYVAAGQMAFNTGKQIYRWYREHTSTPETAEDTYVLFIHEEDALVGRILKHISDTNSFVDERLLFVSSDSRFVDAPPGDPDADEDGEVFRTVITMRPDEELRELEFTLEDKYDISVKMQTGKPGQTPPTQNKPTQEDLVGYSYTQMERYLVLTCTGADAFDSLSHWINSLFQDKKRRRPPVTSTLWTYTTTNMSGGWNARQVSQQRSMDSVTLRSGQMERIMKDIKEFLSLEQSYIDYGLRYRRGHLYYSIPGCGKSSFVNALASHLGIDVYYMNLSSLNSNDELTRALDNVEPKSFVIFEDVDVVVPTRTSSHTQNGVTLDHLLNVLDGMLTPHGAMFILTTNDRSKLDEALIRPGRVDLEMQFHPLDDDQMSRMISHFLGRKIELPSLGDKIIVPAALSDIFKRNLHNREAALPEIQSMLEV